MRIYDRVLGYGTIIDEKKDRVLVRWDIDFSTSWIYKRQKNKEKHKKERRYRTMTVVVFKTSSHNFYQIKNVDTIEDLMEIYPSVIVEHNFWYGENPKDIAKWWDITFEDAKIVSTLPYSVEIYDDYRE